MNELSVLCELQNIGVSLFPGFDMNCICLEILYAILFFVIKVFLLTVLNRKQD